MRKRRYPTLLVVAPLWLFTQFYWVSAEARPRLRGRPPAGVAGKARGTFQPHRLRRATAASIRACRLARSPRIAPRQIIAVQFRRTMCLGRCPAYEVTLRRHGTARYHGKEYAPRRGVYQATLHRANFDQLARLLVKQGFFGLCRSYRAQVTCQPSQILRVQVGRKWYQVLEYGDAGPLSLWALHQVVDSLAYQLKWRRPGTLKRPKLTPAQFAQAVTKAIHAHRRRLRLPALSPDPGLAGWAAFKARQRFVPRTRGTRYKRFAHSVAAHLSTCGRRAIKDTLERLTSDRQSPLRDRAFRYLGVGAAYHATEGTWCVIVLLGR